MISAMEYARRHAGKVVKLSSNLAKEQKLDSKQPIGIVVGSRKGTKGIVGSSKVAVFREEYELNHSLSIKTDKRFDSVIPNPPHPNSGIYFLSVNCLELFEPPKPIVIYPNRCARCGCPARSGKSFDICSNANCKVNRKTIKGLGPFPKVRLLDKDGHLLCPTCQINYLDFADQYGSRAESLICRNGHAFKHNWKEGQKFLHRGLKTYFWRKGQLSPK